ncbi:hypothetical protein DFH09DRAFT_1422249 [Mycena vulgaris]|nr:hypothetical protein DFH09DRAFT_1422249 [Mycena vulgaris]
MKLSIIATLATLAALAFPGTLAALTLDEVVTAINVVANISESTSNKLATASGVMTSSADQFQVAVSGDFGTIIGNLMTDTTAFEATPPFTDAGEDMVAALRRFAANIEAMVAILVRDRNFFVLLRLGQIILSALRELEPAIDAFCFALTVLFPTQVNVIEGVQAQLDSALDSAISIYDICAMNLFELHVLSSALLRTSHEWGLRSIFGLFISLSLCSVYERRFKTASGWPWEQVNKSLL